MGRNHVDPAERSEGLASTVAVAGADIRSSEHADSGVAGANRWTAADTEPGAVHTNADADADADPDADLDSGV